MSKKIEPEGGMAVENISLSALSLWSVTEVEQSFAGFSWTSVAEMDEWDGRGRTDAPPTSGGATPREQSLNLG